jgi:hypothetical protein
MKVLVFGPYAINTPHFETDLEIVQSHLDRGDEVTFLACNSEMPACDNNPNHYFERCLQCISKRVAGIGLLSSKIDVRSFFNLTERDRHELSGLRVDFSSIEDLKSYRIENFDIGWGVLCSTIFLTRDPVPALRELAGLVRQLVVSSFSVYRSMQNQLDRIKPDRVYIYNGRFAAMRAAMRACQSRKIPFFTHERGHDLNHYALFEEAMPQNLKYRELDIRKQWAAAAGNPEREKIASQFYLERRQGVVQAWFSFVKDQQPELLPSNWDGQKNNIVVFISSEDERAALGEDRTGLVYSTQLAGLKRILESLDEDRRNLHVYLRMHPNLRGVKNEYARSLMSLTGKCLTIISPEDPVSSYALVDAADKVLTFGSSVGIEAVFWGKPSILVGQSLYWPLGGTYTPGSHEEVIELLKGKLEPKDKEAALMYGYYMKTFGIPFKYFKATGIFEGEFMGRKVEHSPWATAILKATRLHSGLERLTNKLFRFYTARRLAA